MNTKQMIEVMQAFEDGKEIEFRERGSRTWKPDENPEWDWSGIEYRIAPEPEPKKEGRWERVEIRVDEGRYCIADDWTVNQCESVPGFGGIDYQSPFNPNLIVRSMGPMMFEKGKGGQIYWGYSDKARPGIPVAAWFWREGEK